MNPRTMPARDASLPFVATEAGQTSDAGFPSDFQEMCSFAMDQAIGIEKASLATVVCLNSCAIDIYKNGLWFSPVLGNLFDAAAQAFASCMELQMNFLARQASHISGTVASIHGMQVRQTAEVLERSMDIVTGALDAQALVHTFTGCTQRSAATAKREDTTQCPTL